MKAISETEETGYFCQNAIWNMASVLLVTQCVQQKKKKNVKSSRDGI